MSKISRIPFLLISVLSTSVLLSLESFCEGASPERLSANVIHKRSIVKTVYSIPERKDVQEVLKQAFSFFDQGSMDLLTLFSDDAFFRFFKRSGTGDTYVKQANGKKDATILLEEFYKPRGKLSEPTSYKLVNYAYPQAWVNGVIHYDAATSKPFDLVIMFKESKIAGIATFSDFSKWGNIKPSFASTQEVVAGFFSCMDTGNISAIIAMFPQDLDVTLVSTSPSRPKPATVRAHSVQQMKAILTHFQATRRRDTESKVAIVESNLPYVTVSGTIQYQGDSQPLAYVNAVFVMVREQRSILKVESLVCYIHWTEEIEGEFIKQG